MDRIEKLLIKYIIVISVVILVIANWEHLIGYFNQLVNILMPVIVGGVMAYVLNLLMERYEKMLIDSENEKLIRFRRPLSILMTFLTVVIAIIVVIGIVVPQLSSAVSAMISSVPVLIENVQKLIRSNETLFPQISGLMEQINLDWGQIAQNVVNFLNDVVTSIISSVLAIVSNLASHLINLVLSIMISLYLLAYKETLSKQITRILNVVLKPEVHQRLLHVLKVMDESFSNFIIGSVTEATILGTLVTLGMLVIKLPYASMIGVLAGVFALIPVLGAYISATIGTLMILAISPSQALVFLVFILVVQQFEGNVVYPRVVGDSIGLPGIWVIIAVTLFGGLFGIQGMLVGVPLAATVYKLIREAVVAREDKLQEVTENHIVS